MLLTKLNLISIKQFQNFVKYLTLNFSILYNFIYYKLLLFFFK